VCKKGTDSNSRWLARFVAEQHPDFKAKEAECQAHWEAGRHDDVLRTAQEADAIAVREMREMGID
jgi:hypothetical protein